MFERNFNHRRLGRALAQDDERSRIGTPMTRGQESSRSLAVLTLVLFLTFLDTTIVAVALASIQSTLHAGVAQLQWVVGGYALVFAALMLAFGKIGDRFGRRKILVVGMGVFVAGSIVCAVAINPTMLIAGRAVMGLGAAASEPGTLSMMRQLYPEESRRARALGVWAAVAGLAIAMGPVFGGVLTGIGGFRAMFWFNVAAGLIVTVLSMTALPESFDLEASRLDVRGAILGAISLALLVTAVIEGEGRGYASPVVVGLFVVGVLGGVFFVAVELKADDPLINLRYLRIPSYLVSLVTAFAVYFAIIAVFFFTALYLQLVQGYSGYRIALIFLPMTVGMVLASLFAGRWVAVSGPRVPMTLGAIAAGVGVLVADAALGAAVDVPLLTSALTLAGLGFGITVVPVTSIALGVIPARHSGMAAATTNTARALGVIVSVSVLGSLLNGELTNSLNLRLIALGVPANFREVVISAVETGSMPTGGSGSVAQIEKAYGPLVLKVINAAYEAFHSGLSIALDVAGILMLVSAVAAAVGFGMRRAVKQEP